MSNQPTPKKVLFQKLQARAERFRAASGWKPGSLVAKSSNDEASLYIYQVIGADFWTGEGVTADGVRAALEGVKGTKTLNVYINSEGGEVFEAFGIYSQLMRFGGTVNVYVDGLCASAATLIAMAGDRISTSEVGTWMVHEPWGGAVGNASDMRGVADRLDMMSETLASLYAEKTGKSLQECLALMSAETWMNAAQALELGFTDEVKSGDPEEDVSAASASKPARALAATERTLASQQAELLAFRARRAGAEVTAAKAEPRPPEPVRASPAKRAQSASH